MLMLMKKKLFRFYKNQNIIKKRINQINEYVKNEMCWILKFEMSNKKLWISEWRYLLILNADVNVHNECIQIDILNK